MSFKIALNNHMKNNIIYLMVVMIANLAANQLFRFQKTKLNCGRDTCARKGLCSAIPKNAVFLGIAPGKWEMIERGE